MWMGPKASNMSCGAGRSQRLSTRGCSSWRFGSVRISAAWRLGKTFCRKYCSGNAVESCVGHRRRTLLLLLGVRGCCEWDGLDRTKKLELPHRISLAETTEFRSNYKSEVRKRGYMRRMKAHQSSLQVHVNVVSCLHVSLNLLLKKTVSSHQNKARTKTGYI